MYNTNNKKFNKKHDEYRENGATIF